MPKLFTNADQTTLTVYKHMKIKHRPNNVNVYKHISNNVYKQRDQTIATLTKCSDVRLAQQVSAGASS